MRKNKISTLLCAALLVAVVLGGCGNSENDPVGSVSSNPSAVQQSSVDEESSEPESSVQESIVSVSVTESSAEESSTVSTEESKKEQSESKPESKAESTVSHAEEQKTQTQTIIITETSKTDEQSQQQESAVPAPVEQSQENSIDDVLTKFERSYVFASGVGGWGTSLNVNRDGSFSGSHHDSNYIYDGGVEEIISEFSGNFYSFRKINDYTYEADISDIVYKNTPGTTGSAGQKEIKYIDAYGLANAKTVRFYLPDTPVSEIPEEGFFWLHISDSRSTLGLYCIYNVDENLAFISYDN